MPTLIRSRRSALLLLIVPIVLVAIWVLGDAGKAAAVAPTKPGFQASALQGPISKVALLRAGAAKAGPATDAEITNSPIDPDGDVIDVDHVVRPAVSPATRQALNGGLLVAPTTDGSGLCVAGAGRMACDSAENIDRRGAIVGVTWNAKGQVALTGLTTDSVPQVTVAYSDGTSTTVSATDNTLNTVLPKRPTSVSWTGPAGKQAITIAKDSSFSG